MTRKVYTVNFKIQIIEFSKIHGNRLASRHFSVNEKQFQNWKKDQNSLRLTKKSKKTNRVIIQDGQI